jgi:hypothetical protein
VCEEARVLSRTAEPRRKGRRKEGRKEGRKEATCGFVKMNWSN